MTVPNLYFHLAVLVGIASGSVRLPSRLSRDAIHTVSGTIKLMQPLEALGKAPFRLTLDFDRPLEGHEFTWTCNGLLGDMPKVLGHLSANPAPKIEACADGMPN